MLYMLIFWQFCVSTTSISFEIAREGTSIGMSLVLIFFSNLEYLTILGSY